MVLNCPSLPSSFRPTYKKWIQNICVKTDAEYLQRIKSLDENLYKLLDYLTGECEMLMLTKGIQPHSYTRALEAALSTIVVDKYVNVWIPSFPHSAAVVMTEHESYDSDSSIAENLERAILPGIVAAVQNEGEDYAAELERMGQRCHSWTVQWKMPRVVIQHPERPRVQMILTYAEA